MNQTQVLELLELAMIYIEDGAINTGTDLINQAIALLKGTQP